MSIYHLNFIVGQSLSSSIPHKYFNNKNTLVNITLKNLKMKKLNFFEKTASLFHFAQTTFSNGHKNLCWPSLFGIFFSSVGKMFVASSPSQQQLLIKKKRKTYLYIVGVMNYFAKRKPVKSVKKDLVKKKRVEVKKIREQFRAKKDQRIEDRTE